MEPVILQSLSNIDGFDTFALVLSQVDDELVAGELDPVVVDEGDLEVFFQSGHHVVGVQDGDRGGERRGQPDLGVHVGTVKVHLPAVGMDQVDDFTDRWFEQTVSGWVCDHDGGQLVLVLLNLCVKVVEVQRTVGETLNRDHLEVGHGSGGRVGTVGRHWDQTDVSLSLTLGFKDGIGSSDLSWEFWEVLDLRNRDGFGGEQFCQVNQILFGDGFIKGQRHSVRVNFVQIGLVLFNSSLQQLISSGTVQFDSQGVKPLRGFKLMSGVVLNLLSQDRGVPVDSFSDLLQSIWAVVHNVVSSDVGQESLGGTDVGRGLVSLDVLFSGLQSQSEGPVAQSVLGDTDNSPRDLSVELLDDSEETCVWTTEAQRNTESLRGTKNDVSAELGRWG
ncbi:hypothetical protein WICPIJ_005451 [Wickerhamomyces pijperi]|uniref:Uncharacterized protein n=1 Tax=Wickerhamomyces pijperi TaxID=599730 RepID=A0A9P8Q666_WICPI|nr:hypothetical protein WICPIJ_005451 [Wickerhamomyces pijperi]